MKEEFQELKNSALNFNEKKADFLNERNKFNENSMLLFKGENIFQYFEIGDDFYTVALRFREENSDLYELADELHNTHPKYQEKRVKETLIAGLTGKDNSLNMMDLNEISQKVDIYMLFEKAGFRKVYDASKELEESAKLVDKSVSKLYNVTQDAVVKTGLSFAQKVTSFVKPYGEVAKGQLNDVKKATMRTINNGSKKLIKILNDVEKKTSSNKEDDE